MMEIPPCEAMRRANELLLRCTQAHRFVTFFLSLLDPATGRLEFCNAGHNPPFVVTAAGELRKLQTSGAVLGLLPGFEYRGGAVDLGPGDLVAIYSDGVTEALDDADTEFGEEGLLEVLRATHREPAPVIQRAIIDAVKSHAGRRSQSDDVTTLIVKRTG
jgi:sigma-B regulation protein RsbU (phosphoserine phosphatase)